MHDRDRLQALLVERSLKLGDFTLSSGERSSYYIDARRTTLSAEGQALIGRIGCQVIAEHGLAPTAVGGLTLGADPIAYAVAHASWLAGTPIDAFSVRKSAKGHGAGRIIEGPALSGARALVVEDVITTGESALRAIHGVRQAAATVVAVWALVDRESGGVQRIEAEGYRVITLFRAAELLAAAGATGRPPAPGSSEQLSR